jgi:hypothetical protein
MKNEYRTRVRGKVGQVEDPPELAGAWAWSIFVVLDGVLGMIPVRDIHSYELSPMRLFATRREAELDLERESITVCAIINQGMGGSGEEGFFDLKDDLKHKTTFEKYLH